MRKKAAELSPLEEESPKHKKNRVECVKEVLVGIRISDAKRRKSIKTRRKP